MAEPQVINLSSNQTDVNFGGGIEMLMNEKHKSDKNVIGSVDVLEEELNDLSTSLGNGPPPSDDAQMPRIEPSIGRSTSEQAVPTPVDNFRPIDSSFDPDKADDTPAPSKEDLLREKFNYLRKLEDLEKKGVTLSKHYTMDANLNEMQGEYETIVNERSKANSVKFQGKVLMACITGIEFLNNKFDPFDIKLDGWGEQINENLGDYDDVFSELHEKYKSKGKLAPEIKLMFQLVGSAMMLHMTNTMFKTAIPSMDEIMKQNPEMMQQFTNAAMASMNKESPGFGSFMSDMGGMGGNAGPQYGDHVEAAIPERRARPAPASSGTSMQGPSATTREDISDILSGMKKIDTGAETDKSSTISMQDLKDLAGQHMPQRPRRRRKDKDIVSVSLDV